MIPIETQELVWDGRSLSLVLNSGDDAVLCIVPRETIHSVSPYDDAISREIDRDKVEIFERIRPFILSKIDSGIIDRSGPVARVTLERSDLNRPTSTDE